MLTVAARLKLNIDHSVQPTLSSVFARLGTSLNAIDKGLDDGCRKHFGSWSSPSKILIYVYILCILILCES